MSGREQWNNNSEARLKHELLNKRLIEYLATLKPNQIEVSKKPELMNQLVFFMELAMGDQNENDYLRIVQLIKPVGVVSRDMLGGIFQSLMVGKKLESDFMKVWDDEP